MSAKPAWWEYAANLANRMGGAPDTLHTFKYGAGDPCGWVVGVLGYAAEDERLDEFERARCKEWLDRLVWPSGEPKGDDRYIDRLGAAEDT